MTRDKSGVHSPVQCRVVLLLLTLLRLLTLLTTFNNQYFPQLNVPLVWSFSRGVEMCGVQTSLVRDLTSHLLPGGATHRTTTSPHHSVVAWSPDWADMMS